MNCVRLILIVLLLSIVPRTVASHSELQWGREGLPVCSLSGNQQEPSAAPDGVGGAIVVWADDRYGTYDLYAQRVDGEAYLNWDSVGVLVSTRATHITVNTNQVIYDDIFTCTGSPDINTTYCISRDKIALSWIRTTNSIARCTRSYNNSE